MNKALVAIASAGIVVAILSPVVSCVYFSERLNATSESYEVQISDLQQENEELWKETEQLKQENEKLKDPYFKEAYLVTELGWYLHGSTDPVTHTRNKFIIYGNIYNVGATNAADCKLIVNFYDNMTLLLSSEIDVWSPINYWSSRYIYEVIDCKLADSVTRIEVERTWTNMP